MQRFCLALVLTLLAAGGAVAQVTVEVILDQEQYLCDEALLARVRITNRSGKPLKLGREADWLNFTVEKQSGQSVTRIGNPPVQEEFTLESSMAATRRVDLTPYYDLTTPGRYILTAHVKIPEWNRELPSKPRTFEIARGAKLWEQAVGLPGSSPVPETRKFILQQALIKRLTLYVRITDESEFKTFRIMPVGPLVSFSRPEAQVDKESNLHLLFQTGARSFRYSVITPGGEVLLRQTHDYGRTRPVLRPGEDGRVLVIGGQRRFAADDLPAPAAATHTNDAPPATR